MKVFVLVGSMFPSFIALSLSLSLSLSPRNLSCTEYSVFNPLENAQNSEANWKLQCCLSVIVLVLEHLFMYSLAINIQVWFVFLFVSKLCLPLNYSLGCKMFCMINSTVDSIFRLLEFYVLRSNIIYRLQYDLYFVCTCAVLTSEYANAKSSEIPKLP